MRERPVALPTPVQKHKKTCERVYPRTRTEDGVATRRGLRFRKTTLLVIAHRASTVEWLDRIVFLSAGRVVDIGPHRELLERCAAYRTLWSQHRLADRPTDAAIST